MRCDKQGNDDVYRVTISDTDLDDLIFADAENVISDK